MDQSHPVKTSSIVDSSTSRWIKCISTHGNLRGVAIQATELIRLMSQTHQIQGEASIRLGEAVMGALLIASYCKAGERVNLNVQGSGFIKQALVDAYPDGAVRGYVISREGSSEGKNTASSSSEKGPWGDGLMSVLRTKSENMTQPYIGTVPLLTGHLAKDLTFYWAQSEQIPSAVGLVVNLDETGRVREAGGFLVQVLPGASPEEVSALEQNIQEIQSLAEEFAKDADPLQLLSKVFQSTSFMVLEEKAIQFCCNCSSQRVERALSLVGVDELRAMLSEDHKAVIRCDFCTTEYRMNPTDLERLIESATSRGPGSSSLH